MEFILFYFVSVLFNLMIFFFSLYAILENTNKMRLNKKNVFMYLKLIFIYVIYVNFFFSFFNVHAMQFILFITFLFHTFISVYLIHL